MKILYIGNFTQAHCTEVHLAATLENLGHEVIRAQENEWSGSMLTGVIGTGEIDMLLFTRTWGSLLTLDHLALLREHKIPSVSYHLDLYVGLERKYLHEGKSLDQILRTDPFWRTDFVFTPDGDPHSAEIFKENGVKHYFMRPGVFKPECYMAPYEADHDGTRIPRYDALFVGGGDRPGSPHAYGHPEWNYRNELIAWLYDTYGEQFTKFGHPQETIRNAELNQLYAYSKVVVGDSVCIDFNHEYYWSDRVCETLGRGGFLIHPWIKGMDEEFIDGEHLVYYKFGDFDDLKAKIDYYLEHDEERERIRKAGHEFVKEHATYNDRLSQMLDIIKDAEVVPTPASAPIKINLGSGSEPKEGWVNVDWVDAPKVDATHNLTEFPWPFPNGSASEIYARDVLEHMPLFNQKQESVPVKFIEEAHRILQPGGKLFLSVPHWQSKNCWIDPTHARGYDERSFDYFDDDKELGKAYGYYSLVRYHVTAVRTPNDNVEFTMIKV